MQMDFQVVMKAAKAELMNFVGKDALQPELHDGIVSSEATNLDETILEK